MIPYSKFYTQDTPMRANIHQASTLLITLPESLVFCNIRSVLYVPFSMEPMSSTFHHLTTPSQQKTTWSTFSELPVMPVCSSSNKETKTVCNSSEPKF